MKIKSALLLGALLAATLAGSPLTASARGYHHHGGVRFGLAIGVPLAVGAAYYYGPRYYPAPYYYPPAYYYPPVAPIVINPAPVTYVEQSPPPVASNAPSSNSWYFCEASRTYYPYVKECPGGWQQVAPTPPR